MHCMLAIDVRFESYLGPYGADTPKPLHLKCDRPWASKLQRDDTMRNSNDNIADLLVHRHGDNREKITGDKFILKDSEAYPLFFGKW